MKRLFIALAALVLILGLGIYGVVVWSAAGVLCSPARKPLQPQHKEWLADAPAHGMAVTAFRVGTVPVLMCEPSAAAGPGMRGRILRRQLLDKGRQSAPYGTMRGTLVLLHGRGCRKEDLLLVAERFCAAGFRCLLPDLPGHGDNKSMRTAFGTDPQEQRLPGRVLSDAADRFGFNPQPAGLWGLSMGGAYALQAAAAEPDRWEALVVVSTFDALLPLLDEITSREMRGMAPFLRPGLQAAVRLRHGFWPGAVRPVDAARALRTPILVAHGMSDQLIDAGRGKRLFAAVPHPRKRWVEVESGSHGNVLVTPMPLFSEMSDWFLAWCGPPPRAVALRTNRQAGSHLPTSVW